LWRWGRRRRRRRIRGTLWVKVLGREVLARIRIVPSSDVGVLALDLDIYLTVAEKV